MKVRKLLAGLLAAVMTVSSVPVASVMAEQPAVKEAEETAKKYGMTTEDFLKELGGIDVLKYDMIMRKAIEVMKNA